MRLAIVHILYMFAIAYLAHRASIGTEKHMQASVTPGHSLASVAGVIASNSI